MCPTDGSVAPYHVLRVTHRMGRDLSEEVHMHAQWRKKPEVNQDITPLEGKTLMVLLLETCFHSKHASQNRPS